jgi:hypothetical protein
VRIQEKSAGGRFNASRHAHTHPSGPTGVGEEQGPRNCVRTGSGVDLCNGRRVRKRSRARGPDQGQQVSSRVLFPSIWLKRYKDVPEATLRIMCPSLMCRKILAVPVSSRGKTVKCKSCGGMIRVPPKQQPAPAAPEGAEEAAKASGHEA